MRVEHAGDGYLPPYSRNGLSASDVAPHKIAMDELSSIFAITDHREKIFENFIAFRKFLVGFEISGFQWIGGSFTRLSRNGFTYDEPNDIDVVTLVQGPYQPALNRLSKSSSALRGGGKHAPYDFVDNNFILLPSKEDANLSQRVINSTRDIVFWSSVFGHRKISDPEKCNRQGFLEIEL